MKKYSVLVVLVIVLAFGLVSCGGGDEWTVEREPVRETTVDAEDCLEVELLRIEPGFSSVNLVGVVSNRCSRPVSTAVIKSYCYTSAGETIGPDLAAVRDLEVGEREDFDALMATVRTDPKTIVRCTQEIGDAFYEK